MTKELPSILRKFAALPFWVRTVIALMIIVPVQWTYVYARTTPESLKESLLEKTPYGTTQSAVHEALEREWTDKDPMVPEWCSEEGPYHQYSDEVIMHVAFYEPIVPFSVLAVFCFDQNKQLQNIRMKRTWDWW